MEHIPSEWSSSCESKSQFMLWQPFHSESHLICLNFFQRQQNSLKYVTEEWASIEYELLRERGLWGPPIGSHMDKFMLEMTEGPCRMRKKMVRNDMFYIHYPYIPEIEPNTNSAQVIHFNYDLPWLSVQKGLKDNLLLTMAIYIILFI